MGVAQRNDGVLQVLGKDSVHYDFSDNFRKQHNLATIPPATLSVAADAELYASSGKILTRKEAEEQALERMLLEKLQLQERTVQAGAGQALSILRPHDQIKPGNRVNVRVVDPNRNTSANRDQTAVRVTASSGDIIRAFPLVETEPFSGVFEGAIPTASAEATAFASDSAEGALPAFAISGGNHPSWRGQPDNVRPKFFSVDLKDNVLLGKLKLIANEANRKLKGFSLQTSLNGRDFTTVGRWPEFFVPWDGSLEAELVRYDGKKPAANLSLEEMRDYLEGPFLAYKSPRELLKLTTLAPTWDKELGPIARRLSQEQDKPFILHLRGIFSVSRRQTLTFQLNAKGRAKPANACLAIDGQTDSKDKTTLTRLFQKGVYRLEVYFVSTCSSAPAFDVVCDLVEPPNLAVAPYEAFDPEKHPELKAAAAASEAKVAPGDQESVFDVSFSKESRARLLRFVLHDFETDAPAIRRLELANAEGKTLLPTQQDLTTLKNNQVLEIVPGDRISIHYENPDAFTSGTQVQEVSLTATFTNATLSACFVEFGEPDRDGNRRAHYAPMRRFNTGEKVNVFIRDPDCDVSDQPDKVVFTAKVTNGQPVECEALETAPHSGIFVGACFPVTGAPQRKSELKVAAGDEIFLSYFDRENIDPGIPWPRAMSIEQAFYRTPELRVYDVTSQAAPETKDRKPPKTVKGPKAVGKAAAPSLLAAGEEVVPATRTMTASRPASAKSGKPASLLMEGPLVIEVLWPTIALSPESKAVVFVQTSSGRKAFDKPLTEPYDLRVPGTLRLESAPSLPARLSPPPGYRDFVVKTDLVASTPLDDGRFTFVVPLALGSLPKESPALEEEGKTAKTAKAGRRGEEQALAIQGTDEIFIGFRYQDERHQTQWLTARAALNSEAHLDVMDRHYHETAESAYVGETIYFRVLHKAQDLSPQKDRLTVELTASSGAKQSVELVETYEHSGAFKGFVKLAHAQDKETIAAGGALPVQFGDRITVVYPVAKLERALLVHKGADGSLAVITKQYGDSAMAVQTQFAVAEAYFELAKRHRQLKEESLARREIAQGKKLLQEALREHPEAGLRAHGEFLLANLAYELAELTENEDLRRQGYQEALARFNDLLAAYTDSSYAAKSQYKKALCLEKMGQMDQACEEFVKISYRYPNDYELIGNTVLRLGQYFIFKGKELDEQFKAKDGAAKAEKDAEKAKVLRVEGEKFNLRAKTAFRTAGQVLSRMERYSTHPQAAGGLIKGGQCFIQAGEFEQAVAVLKRAAEDPNTGREAAAEALYWAGHASMEANDLPNAYRFFKKITWDYTDSKYLPHAKSRLADPKLARLRE
jgi:tetratricopeptide (TPR) repeat protein